MQNPKEQTQELTYLSKTNITQTLLLYKEAQSYLQEQMCKELFEEQLNETDFLEQSKENYQTNAIVNAFADVLKAIENSLDKAIAMFHAMQKKYNAADIYDAIENNFVFYFLTVNIDVETFIETNSKTALQLHLKEAKECYKEIIEFVKFNTL